MMPRNSGHIVNIASQAGKTGVPGIATYSATKHAVVGLSEAVRAEMRGRNIEISCVMPTVVNTELTAGVGQKWVKPVEATDVAEAIAEALEVPRFDVYVPKSNGALLRGASPDAAGGGRVGRPGDGHRQTDDRGRPRRARGLRGARRPQHRRSGPPPRRTRAAWPPERWARRTTRPGDALFASFYDRALKASEENGLGDMRRRPAGRGARPRGRDRRRDRREPRPLRRRGRGPDLGRARPAHGRAAARAARRPRRREGRRRCDPPRASRRGARRSDPVRRRHLRHRGRDARPLHGSRPGRRDRRAGPRPQTRRPTALHRARPLRGPSSARWQDRLEKPWRFMADGCHCNRDTEANLRASSFSVESVDHGKLPKALPIVRPLIRGTAVLAGGVSSSSAGMQGRQEAARSPTAVTVPSPGM